MTQIEGDFQLPFLNKDVRKSYLDSIPTPIQFSPESTKIELMKLK